MDARVAVVTGGVGALGGAVVEALLADGWSVHVPWTSETSEAGLLARVGKQALLATVRADLTDPDAVDAFFGAVRKASGRLDLLCNLVGGFAMAAVEDTAAETWERMLGVNATAPFLSIRAAVPLLRETGGGSIVNVAAAALERPAPGMSAYLASKAAVANLTRTLAEELARDGITVNAVAPTTIDTPANRQAMPSADRSGWLAPDAIADVIRFLAGPQARIVTGNVVGLRRG
jgi:NAD(P)-dependent dehydrogenase (short-subunit alcohol dehydrogenase family)